MNAEKIIRMLNLVPLPIEGGYYQIIFRADEKIPLNALPKRYNSTREFAGTIYFLETQEQFSAMHKLPTDGLYYHHLGDPVEMLVLAPDGTGFIQILGTDLDAGHRPQLLAPRNHWHGSRPLPGGGNGFSLMSTSMAPAFAETDPLFAEREELAKQYPEFRSMIHALTRLEPHNV